MECTYEIPKWAAKPLGGFHLDVMKGHQLVQKHMIDDKNCYIFGRSPRGTVDVCVDHKSCSRFHASLVYHNNLKRFFLTDLGSTHGTYIGNLRIEANKPVQLPIDSTFRFGASTRHYVIRERPEIPIPTDFANSSDYNGVLFGLPESTPEVDNLTEFNTAHNRRVCTLGILNDDTGLAKNRNKNLSVWFNDDEEIINPEDVDPSVGRFRNLVQSVLVPSAKRIKLDTEVSPNLPLKNVTRVHPPPAINSSVATPFFVSLSSKLGLPLPNPAPAIADVAMEETLPSVRLSLDSMEISDDMRKKKYAKEAWPGKSTPNVLLV